MTLAREVLETIHLGLEYSGRAPSVEGAPNGEMKMNEPNEQATRLETAQSDLKQLMADVTRAMEKAQEAVARITSTVAATTADTESTNTSR
jgi:hypothetical protein